MQSYGMMLYLKEVEGKFGFHDFLFEELSEYNLDEYMDNYEKWFHGEIEKGLADVKAGHVKTAQQSI